MTRGLKLFVSFSSRDQNAVRMLFSALALQHIDVWDYSREGEKLALGRPIEESLAEKIALCDYFFAVVSANSADPNLGRYPDFEVHCALENGLADRRRLLPLLLLTNPPNEWSGSYKRIEGLLCVKFNPSEQEKFDDAVRRICDYLSMPYVPPILNDPRVFFSRRFQQELNSQELSTADYWELMKIIIGSAERVAENSWDEAGKLISLFLELSKFKVPQTRFYYPHIIKGVCELQAGSYKSAELTFAHATEHPLHDETSFGGLGHAYFYQDRYDEALAAFRKALELKPSDKTIEFNILGALVHAAAPFGEATVPETFDDPQLSPEDHIRVGKLRGIALIARGEYEDAVNTFELMATRAPMDAASAIYYSRALEACGRVNEAIAILHREATRQDDLNTYHHLADAYLRAKMIPEALHIYENKLCVPGCWTRQYLVEYARVLSAVGGAKNCATMREVCTQVLDEENFGDSPTTPKDFYYMGFANYLLGNHELARYDYKRCGRLFEYYG